jgi:hypothetical protein
MTIKLLLPALLLAAACGDNLEPEDVEDQSSSGTEDGSGHEETSAREIEASIFIETITCTETIARFEAGAQYADDGTPLTNYTCLWTFDDGTTSNECVGEHQFAEAGDHDFVLEVTDLDTGATDVVTQTRFFYPPLVATLDVSTLDLAIAYIGTSNTGGEQVVFVSPEEFVISDDPNYPRNTSGVVRVTQPGTYTVTYDVEDERGVSEICSARVVKEITVVCGHDDHVH